jgi:DNA-binding transcriptional regulator YdaS (Cro superfamily)
MLKEIIDNSGQTQTAWAALLGISKGYLSDIVNGNRVPSLEVAVAIERATKGAVLAASWVPEPVVDALAPTPSEDAA